MSKQDLARTLHESRDHGKDGGELDGYLCNCAEYVDAIWPSIRRMCADELTQAAEALCGTDDDYYGELRAEFAKPYSKPMFTEQWAELDGIERAAEWIKSRAIGMREGEGK